MCHILHTPPLPSNPLTLVFGGQFFDFHIYCVCWHAKPFFVASFYPPIKAATCLVFRRFLEAVDHCFAFPSCVCSIASTCSQQSGRGSDVVLGEARTRFQTGGAKTPLRDENESVHWFTQLAQFLLLLAVYNRVCTAKHVINHLSPPQRWLCCNIGLALMKDLMIWALSMQRSIVCTSAKQIK